MSGEQPTSLDSLRREVTTIFEVAEERQLLEMLHKAEITLDDTNGDFLGLCDPPGRITLDRSVLGHPCSVRNFILAHEVAHLLDDRVAEFVRVMEKGDFLSARALYEAAEAHADKVALESLLTAKYRMTNRCREQLCASLPKPSPARDLRESPLPRVFRRTEHADVGRAAQQWIESLPVGTQRRAAEVALAQALCQKGSTNYLTLKIEWTPE